MPTDNAIFAIAKRAAKQRGWNTVAELCISVVTCFIRA
ncbi:hypothetical protein [Raoultella planticola]|nr:hypothetical protein [Raoultella planticola]HDG9774309.1 hypothetical protein [Raoultella planticola]